MSVEQIRKQIGQAEDIELEYKSAKGGFPESFWETFSAFANTNGGVIVLGVKEKDKKLIPDGLDDTLIAKYKKVFWDCAHNKQKVSATMLANHDVSVENVKGNRVLVFRVPKAAYDLKPVYLNSNPFGNTYRRNHEGDYRCTDAEVRLMVADAESQGHSFDSKVLANYTIEDIDMATLRAYRQRFLLRHENHPWNELDDMQFLTKIGAYYVNREDGSEGFTRAGILMLGKTESIMDQSCAPWYFVDYQEKLSSDPMLRWTDRLYPDGTWEANLFQFFYRTYGKLAQLLPTPFMLKGTDRQEETSAHVALREALANCLIHCNYAQQGNILVVGRRNEITMRNPGCMLISVADFYAGSHSICRNPLLQKLFMFLGNGEKAGSGADIIKKGWADNKWQQPMLSERVQPDECLMTLTLISGKSDFGKDFGKEQNGTKNDPKDDPKELTERQSLMLKLIEEDDLITIQLMTQKMKVSEKTVKRELAALQEKGILTREGGRKSGRWVIKQAAN
ncbi:MAG: putative DNA binding domain-containing protein [Bacteroidales bacterium]|nr:putative DNA binding domain-containing protein [Bacteroidales bacterium]